jgi:putative ABC transport system ATP-binding protein
MAQVQAVDATLVVAGRTLIDNFSFTVDAGRSMAISGRSGSGKTSLLHCVAGLSTDYRGSLRLAGQELADLGVDERARLRLQTVGMIFQFGELISELTVLDNVALPARLAGHSRRTATDRAIALLDRLDIFDRREQFPYQLSGGERQRAAVARSLVNNPVVVLADEPTGALDEDTAALVSGLMLEVCRERATAVLIATHDLDLANATDAHYRIQRFRLTPALTPAEA